MGPMVVVLFWLCHVGLLFFWRVPFLWVGFFGRRPNKFEVHLDIPNSTSAGDGDAHRRGEGGGV